MCDDRIIAADDHAVTFRYTDSATKERKECTLTADALFVCPPQGAPVSLTLRFAPGHARRATISALRAPSCGVISSTCCRRDSRFDFAQGPEPAEGHRVRYFGWMHPAAGARRMKVATLLAVVIVVIQQADTPAWHLYCPHCHAFTLVRIGRLARAPPTCIR